MDLGRVLAVTFLGLSVTFIFESAGANSASEQSLEMSEQSLATSERHNWLVSQFREFLRFGDMSGVYGFTRISDPTTRFKMNTHSVLFLARSPLRKLFRNHSDIDGETLKSVFENNEESVRLVVKYFDRYLRVKFSDLEMNPDTWTVDKKFATQFVHRPREAWVAKYIEDQQLLGNMGSGCASNLAAN